MHVVPSLSQSVILGMDFMLDYELVLNALMLTAEFRGSFKFALQRLASGAFSSVKVVAAEMVTIPEQYTLAVTIESGMTSNVDYAFIPRILSRSRLRALDNLNPVEMITSQRTATTNSVIFINSSEYPICIRKREKV